MRARCRPAASDGDIGQGSYQRWWTRTADVLRRAAVHFEQASLIAPPALGVHPADTDGGFDVIFCRNVLMYFDEEAARQTLELIYSLLKEGGYLLLGHAESLLPLGSGLRPVQFGRELVHQK